MKKILLMALVFITSVILYSCQNNNPNQKSNNDSVAVFEGFKITQEFINNFNSLSGVCNAYSEGLAVIIKDGKYGYIDKNATIVIPIQYDLAYDFCEGLACVRKDEKYGFIDKKGDIVIPFQYEIAYPFSEGLAIVGTEKDNGGKKYGFINKSGDIIIPIQFEKYVIEQRNYFHEGLALIEKNDKYGYIDKKGNVVIPTQYNFAQPFSNGLAAVQNEKDKWGYIDNNGIVVIPFQYDIAHPFNEGIANVELNDRWGGIDKNGNIIIPFEFDFMGKYSEGLAPVRNGDKFGYIDNKGDIVIPLQFDDANSFSEGLASVGKNDKYGAIDKNGNPVIPIKFNSSPSPCKEGLSVYQDAFANNGRSRIFGYFDSFGNTTLPAEYYEYWKEENVVKRQQEEEIAEQNRQQAVKNAEQNSIIEVLQGAWEWCGSISPNQLTVAQLYIEGDYIKDLSDGMENAQGSIREIDFDNGKIYYGRDNYLNFLIDKDGDFHLYGGRRSIQFQKLSERTLEYRSKYNEHLKWWEDAYNAYRINKYPNSTIQNIKDMKYALGYLQDDVDHGGNKKMKERVRELARITGELQPY